MNEQTEHIECQTLFGETKLIPVSQLRRRVSAYGLILNDDHLLLARGRHTGRYALPGGGANVGETLQAALEREIREEVGIAVEVKRYLHFHEDFFYYDPSGHAFHSLMFYYWCAPLSLTLIDDAQVQDEDVGHPQWVPVGDLTAGAFQTQGEVTMQLLETIRALR